MLDKLPAWARHLVIAVAVAALIVVKTGLSHGGIKAIDWTDVGNAGAGAAVAYALLLLTPLTSQFGVKTAAGKRFVARHLPGAPRR